MDARLRGLVAVTVLVVVAGCLGSVGPDRTMETVELTIGTPTTETATPVPTRTVRFLGPDRGGSAVISDGSGSGIVVDTGGDANATRVRAALRRAGIERYDLWITGFNETRLGGAPALLGTRPPENIGFSGLTANTSQYDRFLRAVVDADRQYRLYRTTAPFSYSPAVGEIAVLAPPGNYSAGRRPAHNEIALAYTAHDRRVLWLGDPGRLEERRLLNRSDGDLEARVVVLAAGATPSDRLLAAIDPGAVVVQGRAGVNRTAAAVANRTDRIYTPSLSGPVTVRIGPEGTRVHGGLATPTPSVTETSPRGGNRSQPTPTRSGTPG